MEDDVASIDRPPLGPSDLLAMPGRHVREAVLVGLLALCLNLAGNGRVSLWDRDEPRYAGCTREMRVSGDWVHPTFNAEPRYHKPVLIYWLMLAGTAMGGDNPFGARLVSSLAGAGTCLLVWAWGRRMLGARAGLLAALILATAPIVVAESKMATTDATLMFWVVGCQFALWELSQRSSWRAAAVFWVFLGLAILTKSPAGPVLIAASAAVSWWWGGPTAWLRRLRWRWGPLVCALIAVPWNVLIMIDSRGDYYKVAVGYHMIRRMTTGIEEHGGFPGYYVVLSLLTCFPWSALLPAAVAGAWTRRRESPVFGFLLGWVVGPLILLECVRTKLIHYYLPAFPAWALLIAWWLVAVADTEAARAVGRWRPRRVALRTLTGIGLGAIVALLAAAWYVPTALRPPCLALAASMAAGAVLFRVQLRAGGLERAARGLVVTTALCLLVLGTWLLPAAEPYRISGIIGRRLAVLETRERARPILVSYDLPGVVYALGHPAPLVRGRKNIVEQVGRDGDVIAPLLPQDIKVLKKEPRLAIEICETIRGFNVDKGRYDTIHLTVLRPGAQARVDRPGTNAVK
jgi:4-amino-4-deoxy-L-arabinose transferase-like glycosyltransferase